MPTLFDLIDEATDVYQRAWEGVEHEWTDPQGKPRVNRKVDLRVCLDSIKVRAMLCGYLSPKDDRQQLPPEEIRARLTAAITADPVWRAELTKALALKGKE
jgi:hypothetical protein